MTTIKMHISKLIVTLTIAVMGAAAAACAKPAVVGKMRFENQAPVWKVNDRKNVAKKPREAHYPILATKAKAVLFRPADQALAVRAPRRALDVNALGEVPDSTWFTNRMGLRSLTVEDVARGPNRGQEAQMPLEILKGKVGGKSIGFIVEDAAGRSVHPEVRRSGRADSRDCHRHRSAAPVVGGWLQRARELESLT